MSESKKKKKRNRF